MTRAEAYAEGFSEGARWAEHDIRAHTRTDPHRPWRLDPYQTETLRARNVGYCRGYRDTWARYEAGTLTREMFELGPVSPR